MSFAVAGVVVGAAGLATAVYGQVKAGQSASDAAQAASNLGEQNARTNNEMGGVKLDHQQRDAARVIGSAKAQYSASGVDISQGSAMDVIESSTSEAAKDSNQLRYETFARSQAFQMGAQNDALAGQAAQSGANLSAAGTLLTGTASIYASGVKSGVFSSGGKT
jgi:hypothetical protein